MNVYHFWDHIGGIRRNASSSRSHAVLILYVTLWQGISHHEGWGAGWVEGSYCDWMVHLPFLSRDFCSVHDLKAAVHEVIWFSWKLCYDGAVMHDQCRKHHTMYTMYVAALCKSSTPHASKNHTWIILRHTTHSRPINFQTCCHSLCFYP